VALQRRKVLRISAVLGSDASPVQLCSGAETWLDVTIGTTTLTCDFSAQIPQGRRRLQSVPFAQQGQPADISARVWQSTGIPIADSVNTPFPFDMERWDTDNIHNPGDPTKLTPQTPGKYLICGHISFAGNAVGLRQVGLYKNGNPIATSIKDAVTSGGAPGCGVICPTDFSICTHDNLAANDYVELFVLQTSGGPLNVVAGNQVQESESDFLLVKVP
jgi:hypothetical protein